jgi:hypothetical protein
MILSSAGTMMLKLINGTLIVLGLVVLLKTQVSDP